MHLNPVWVTNAICILRLNGYDLLADDVIAGYESVRHGVASTAPVRDAVLDANDTLKDMGLADTGSVLKDLADSIVIESESVRAMA